MSDLLSDGVNVLTGSGAPVAETEVEEFEVQETGTFDPSAHRIPQVKEYVTAHPDQRESVLASEKNSYNRSTLVEWLEGYQPENIEPAGAGAGDSTSEEN